MAGGEVSSPVETRLGDLAGGARVWCSEVAAFASQAQVAAATLLTTVHFARPRLLRLPRSYDAIFQVRKSEKEENRMMGKGLNWVEMYCNGC